MKIKLASIFLITITLIGCSEPKLSYNQEAKIFCDLHKVENWNDFPRGASVTEFKVAYGKKISAAGFSEEFKNVIREIDKIRFLKNLYPSAKEKIFLLTGEQWECPAYRQFHHIEYERVDSEPEPEIVDSSLNIEVSSTGVVIVNGGLMTSITAEEFNKILTRMELKSSVSATVIINKGASGDILNQVMQALKNTEVEDLVLVEK